MQTNLILSALFFGSLFLSACSRSEPFEEPRIETRTIEVQPPAPIIPQVDQLRLRDVEWKVVTPENIDDVFASLEDDVVLFALTADGYEALALNLSDLRANIQQYKEIIAIYESSYE